MSTALFDPRLFFRLAEALGTPGQPEENRRTAVSRAYYACFHVARGWLERGGRWHAGSTNAHQAVISELRRRNRWHLGTRLDSLRQLREHADYTLEVPLEEVHVRDALSAATEFLRVLGGG